MAVKIMSIQLQPLLERALRARESLFDPRHESAFRLFNGFREGYPDLVIDLYATTAVLYNHADEPAQGSVAIEQSLEYLRQELSWLRAGILKTRNSRSRPEQQGLLRFGDKPDTRVLEHDVWYALDLQLNRDASLYLDTRLLRQWLIEHMKGRSVLNTFAYTGSLGVAALAGGASRVLQHDLKRRFLDVARISASLNGFPVQARDFVAADFFSLVARLKRSGESFDCVIIDPPFFSSTEKGRVDQVSESARLINKVRPLIRDGGMLVAINNALYVSGAQYMRTLETLTRDGYLTIRELVRVPEDFTGFATTRLTQPMLDPSPFNHSTKIAILDVRRKSA